MKLFDEVERTETRAMRLTEPQFRYENNSARPSSAAVREVQEAWFAAYPEGPNKVELRGRFRSEDDTQHLGAQFELLLHELLRGMGYDVVPIPETDPGQRRPDFLVRHSDKPLFYAEATIAKLSKSRADREKAMARIQEAINDVPSPDFYLAITFVEVAGETPDLKKLHSDVKRFLDGLDVAEVERTLQVNADDAPCLAWENGGWQMEFHAYPRGPSTRGEPGPRTVGVVSTPVSRIDTEERIREAVRNKAKKKYERDLPLLVAVNALEDHLDDIDIMEALFGKERWIIQPQPDGGLVSNMSGRHPDGAWYRPAENGAQLLNTRVGAVLVCERVSPWTAYSSKTVLVHHPAGDPEFQPAWWPMSQLIPAPSAGRMAPVPGKVAGEFLGLPSPWPPAAD